MYTQPINIFNSSKNQIKILMRHLIIFLIVLSSCKPSNKKEIVWSKYFQSLGTSSSPRYIDLNGDGWNKRYCLSPDGRETYLTPMEKMYRVLLG